MVSREEAENAVKILLDYIEDDVSREGLLDTPSRVI
jgi:GTP cyclohydrolase I